MYNSFHHSAEGSHWTKKNHKYIRKEGNRYIYPEDIKRSAATYTQNSPNYRQLSKQHANREAAKSGNVVNPSIKFTNNAGDISFRVHTNRSFPSNTVSDYKQYSKEMSNQAKRKRAAGRENYKHDVVTSYNGEGHHKHKFSDQDYAKYTIAPKNSDIRKLTNMQLAKKNAERQEAKAQSHAKASNMSATEARQLSKQQSNENKKKAAAGSPNEYVRNQEHAKKMTNIMRSPSINPVKYKDGIGPSPDSMHRRKNAMKKQGSVNRQQEAKDFKEYRDWEKADQKKRDSEPKRKAALNKQGSKSYKYESELYGIRDKDNLSGVRDQVSQKDAKEMSKIHRNTSFQKNLRESNKENNNKMYKLKNRVTKAISNLKNKKKTDKVGNSQEEYYNGKATKNTLKNDKDITYDSLINNAKTKNERKKWQQEKGRLIGTRHYTNDYGVKYDEDVYTNSKAASRGEKRLNYTDRGDGRPINSWDKRGKMVQVAVKSGSDGGGWDVDKVTPENVKAKNYYNRKRKKTK